MWQSTRSTTRSCSRCRQNGIEVVLEANGDESGTIALNEINNYSSSLSNQAAINHDSNPVSITVQSEGTDSSVSRNEIPIPIFTSSQYSIQRRRTRSTPRSSRQEGRHLSSSPIRAKKYDQGKSTKKIWSTDCGKYIVELNFNHSSIKSISKSLTV